MPTLITIESDYRLDTVRERNLFHELRSAKCGGYFDQVWIAHPYNQPGTNGGFVRGSSPRTHDLGDGLHFIEGYGPVDTGSLGLRAPAYFLIGQLRLLAALTALARRNRDAVVRAGEPYWAGLLAFCVSRLARRPLVIRIGAHFDSLYEASNVLAYPRLLRHRGVETRLARFILSRADLVMAATDYYGQFAIANGADPTKVVVTRFGSWVDPIHWEEASVSAPQSLRAELGIPKSSPVLALASRLEPLKYVEDVVEAFRIVWEKERTAVLVVAGEGSLKERLEQQVAAWGLGTSVRFVGPQDQPFVQRLFREADVIAAPLAGRALVEATLSGKPSVVYDCDWHRELINSGRNGMVVPFRDRGALANAIVALLNDPETAQEIGRSGRASVLEMMDPVRLRDVQIRAYERLTADRAVV